MAKKRHISRNKTCQLCYLELISHGTTLAGLAAAETISRTERRKKLCKKKFVFLNISYIDIYR
jgi:hypothetical protein